MSSETEQEKSSQEFLDGVYRELGWTFEPRIMGKANRLGDIVINGERCEEKSLRHDIDLTYEILQATELLNNLRLDGDFCYVPVNAIGNQYTTKAVYQIWACQRDGTWSIVYKVITARLHEYYHSKFETFKLVAYPKGYGLTIFARLPWGELIHTGIAERIWSNTKILQTAGFVPKMLPGWNG